MNHILFLTYRMKQGFGVDVVVMNLMREIRVRGHNVSIGCMDMDGQYTDPQLFQVPANADVVRKIARKLGVDTIVAHSSPFFEILPALSVDFAVYSWEHGDPTPQLMRNRAQLEKQKIFKSRNVYPEMRKVIAISEFIATDIDYPQATVIYNGCDHAKDLGAKAHTDFTVARPLRIGALMRLGKGEAEYKGNALLLKLFRRFQSLSNVECYLMGRGTPNDVAEFSAAGFKVHLNATDGERDAYLRSLDVFVTLSLWEGFNLPLVEAQALGTLAIAADTGAHPEVTPFVFAGMEEIMHFITTLQNDRRLLETHSRLCYEFVRGKFCWAFAADAFLRLLASANGQVGNIPGQLGRWTRLTLRLRVLLHVIREQGFWLIAWRIAWRIYKKIIARGR